MKVKNVSLRLGMRLKGLKFDLTTKTNSESESKVLLSWPARCFVSDDVGDYYMRRCPWSDNSGVLAALCGGGSGASAVSIYAALPR